MSHNVELVVQALEGLQSNVWKDYMFPSAIALTSGAIGIGASYFAVYKQESNKIEINKINEANLLILNIEKAKQSLITFKSQYHESLCSDPIKRVLNIPPIRVSEEKIRCELFKLTFLVPDKHEKLEDWNDINYIGGLFSNYNVVLDAWKKRYELIAEIQDKTSQHYPNNLSINELIKIITPGRLAIFSDITEKAINLTDDLIIALDKIQSKLNKNMKGKLNKRTLKKYGKVIEITPPNNENYRKILQRVTAVDYLKLSKIRFIDEDTLKKSYKPIYN